MKTATQIGHAIYHNFWIEADAQKVYESITEPEHLVNWWPQKCTGKPELGSEYNFYFTDEYDWYGEVTMSKPGEAFHIKMTKSDKDWDPTSFGFDLKENAGKTTVSFWHMGWPECNDHFKISSYCWAILLQGLKNYIEKGIIVPFEERE